MAKVSALLAFFASLPGSSPAVAAGAALPGYVVLPLSLIATGNQATVRVSVNGQSTMLILDTGAPATLLDARFFNGTVSGSGKAAQDQLPPELRKTGTANGQFAKLGMVGSFKAGSLDLGKRPVVLTDLTQNFAQYNNRYANGAIGGLLGEDILHQYSAIIDWRRRGVYLNVDKSKRLKLGPSLASAGWTAIPMAPTNGNHYTVACTVEGQPVRLIVDTGANFTTLTSGIVKFSHMMYNRDNGGHIGHLASTAMTMSMVNGAMVAYPARIEHWKIGGYEIASSVVLVGGVPADILKEQSAGDGPILGLIGAEVLASNNAIIDIAGNTLYLKPTKH